MTDKNPAGHVQCRDCNAVLTYDSKKSDPTEQRYCPRNSRNFAGREGTSEICRLKQMGLLSQLTKTGGVRRVVY